MTLSELRKLFDEKLVASKTDGFVFSEQEIEQLQCAIPAPLPEWYVGLLTSLPMSGLDYCFDPRPGADDHVWCSVCSPWYALQVFKEELSGDPYLDKAWEEGLVPIALGGKRNILN